ncbi:MAG: AsnC family transcriptional regulator [Acidobacteriia bacterium]|nr:AsnC family transcriptional regulator [Terriglobia bacterium]
MAYNEQVVSNLLQLDEQDRKLLNVLQRDFPLDERPFARLAERVNLSEQEVLRRVARYKQERIVRQIGAIFDTRSLGYESSLVAMSVPAEREGRAAAILNEHPGISHNYRRNHHFNLWFTLAVAPTSRLGLQGTVDKLHQMCQADSTRLLPTLKRYKISVDLDMIGEHPPDATTGQTAHCGTQQSNIPLTARQISLVRELQKDLPLGERPFDGLAAAAGLSAAGLLEEARGFLARGQMRRYAAVLRHRAAGFVENAMGVWKVPENEDADRYGMVMASFSSVSHCYRRPTYPDWPYALFSMVHGRTVDDCEQTLKATSAKTGLTEYLALYSSKEYKKTRVQYFTPEAEEWEARALAGQPA